MKIALHYLLLCAIAVVCVFPFWWTLVTAVSTEGNIFAFPPTFWPNEPSLDNFVEVFNAIPIWSFFRNSVFIAACTVFWKLALCSAAAYPLARMQFKGRKLVFGLILATLVLPSEVNFLVNFITVTKLSLVDTYTGVILPNVVTAVAILLLKQAFEEVPQDLIDAARVDGASEWTIFSKIMLPADRPVAGHGRHPDGGRSMERIHLALDRDEQAGRIPHCRWACCICAAPSAAARA